jgi:hypothetical protein
MLARGSADDRYAKALADASKKLREQLGDGEVYEAANTWALSLCDAARRYDWSTTNNWFDKGWDSDTRAARRMAKRLELGERSIMARICAAERQTGIRLNLDVKERGKALTKLFKAVSDQQPPSKRQPRHPMYRTKSRSVYGPLIVVFRFSQNIEFPAPSVAMAVALAHGFREITACFEDGEPMVVERWHLNTRSGDPCWSATRAFASAVFDTGATTAADKSGNTTTTRFKKAIEKWLRNHRRSIKYIGFDE